VVAASPKSTDADPTILRATLNDYLRDWTTVARQGVVEARRLLREVLVDRMVFRPVPRPAELPPVKGRGEASEVGLRVYWRGLNLEAFQRLNFYNFGGGPNGIRTRV
jgi:hypothetical protein